MLSTSLETESRSYKNKKRVIELIKKNWPGGSEIAIGKVKASDIRAFVVSARVKIPSEMLQAIQTYHSNRI